MNIFVIIYIDSKDFTNKTHMVHHFPLSIEFFNHFMFQMKKIPGEPDLASEIMGLKDHVGDVDLLGSHGFAPCDPHRGASAQANRRAQQALRSLLGEA